MSLHFLVEKHSLPHTPAPDTLFSKLSWLVLKRHIIINTDMERVVQWTMACPLLNSSSGRSLTPRVLCWWMAWPSVPCQTAGVLSSLSLWTVVFSFVNEQHDLCYGGVDGKPGRSPWPVGYPWQPLPSLLTLGAHSQGPVGGGCSSTCRVGLPDSGEEYPGLLSTCMREQHGAWADSEPTLAIQLAKCRCSMVSAGTPGTGSTTSHGS